jgi:hypothetical protein
MISYTYVVRREVSRDIYCTNSKKILAFRGLVQCELCLPSGEKKLTRKTKIRVFSRIQESSTLSAQKDYIFSSLGYCRQDTVEAPSAT